MNVKIVLFSLFGSFLIGVGIGLAIYSTFLCTDTNKAIVKQLDKDSEKVREIKKQAEIRYVEVEKIKTVIKEVSGECFDAPIPDVAADGLLNAFEQARPTTD
jgi:hypothetical protein